MSQAKTQRRARLYERKHAALEALQKSLLHQAFHGSTVTMPDEPSPQSSILLYQTEDGRTRIQCRFDGETLWLTQAQIAELFQTTPQNVTLHLKAIFAEGELAEAATCKDYLQVRSEGSREVSRQLRHYRLEAILAVRYRVRSHRGTQFRQWATARLSEYLVKGFAMDDERLMGLKTTRPGRIIRREDVAIAKNYLTEEELQALNRIVNLYIEFAELQALDRRPMTMRDWISGEMTCPSFPSIPHHPRVRVRVVSTFHLESPFFNDLHR